MFDGVHCSSLVVGCKGLEVLSHGAYTCAAACFFQSRTILLLSNPSLHLLAAQLAPHMHCYTVLFHTCRQATQWCMARHITHRIQQGRQLHCWGV